MMGNMNNEVKDMGQYDVIIIGAGPGGMTAALYTQRANLKTLMLEKAAPGGKMMSTWEVENYTGLGKVTGFEISEKMFNHTQELGVEYKYGDVVEIKDLGDLKELHTTSNEVYKAKAVIIATGTIPRGTNAPGETRLNGRGISWCAICDGAFFKDLDIVVVGGGNSAIEEATYLTKIVNHITVVNILPTLQADAKAIEQAKATGKMDFKLGYEILSFDGENKLEAVKIKNAETKVEENIKCDGAFVFIGSLPETTLVKDLGITNKWGYIQVDDKMRTNIPGIFGIGDVIEKDLRQIITAASDGTIAAVEVSRYIETLNK
jgi:thioredoxin reductase (NADPH)